MFILICIPVFSMENLEYFKAKVINFVIFYSSLGQNLKTTTYVTEIAFAIFIAIFGLVLFALLIGNMQVSAINRPIRSLI